MGTKPIYSIGNGVGAPLEDANLDKRGSVTIENVTYKDILRHYEFVDFLKMIYESKRLLNANDLNKSEEKMKKKMLGLLANINYGVKDAWVQSKLMTSVQQRVELVQKYLN